MFSKWKKLGLIYKISKKHYWNKSHAMLPTPVLIKKNICRVFFASRNLKNQSHISFIDYDLVKKKIIYEYHKPSFYPGSLGSFDDNGVVPSSIIKIGKKMYLYYVGWKPQATTRYSLVTGLAISNNNGLSFKRYSKAPILKNSDREPYMILTAPSVIKEKKIWRMWYVSCEKWKNKDYPIYNIKYAYSGNGKNWLQTGKVCIKLKKNERAVARPSVIFKNGKYYMWYCKENKVGTYQLGFAVSKNGINWKRLDKKIGIFKSKKGWDSKMLAYPNVILHKKKYYMFFNGNDYGRVGFGIAEYN
tara:strand:+ start:180 stop:1085 length:906 start_codon:yes stop_codon:yes gene_type:complete